MTNTTTPALKFTKVAAGHYATADGRFAVVVDGYTPSAELLELESITGGEWAACFDGGGNLRVNHQAGATLDWYATKRAAIAACEDAARG
jgi:hypothetical protein